MSELVMRKCRGDGIEINVAEWEGHGRAVICVHGITANCRCWDGIASALAPAHRVLAMDLRGRGLSDRPPSGYSIAHHVGDIAAVMDDLNVKRAALIGHSLGAFIVLAFAARHPERVDRVVAIDGGGRLTEEQLEKVFVAIGPSLGRLGRVYPSVEDYLSEMKSVVHIHPWNPVLEAYYHHEMEPTEGGVRCNIDPDHIGEESTNLRAEQAEAAYPKIACPTLIVRAGDGIVSQEDLVLPDTAVERMVREIRDTRVVTIRNVNHYGIVFQPHTDRNRAILEFLTVT